MKMLPQASAPLRHLFVGLWPSVPGGHFLENVNSSIRTDYPEGPKNQSADEISLVEYRWTVGLTRILHRRYLTPLQILAGKSGTFSKA